MSFGQRTPESLIPRADSKNPATTCKGITTNGRPCRRGLAQASPLTSPAPSPNRGNGVLAVLDDGDATGRSAAAFYCWQHKDQAESLVADDVQKTRLVTLKERSSLDTLVDRVGVMNLDEEVVLERKKYHKVRRRDEPQLKKRDTLPSGWHDMQSPLMTVPEDVLPGRPKPRPSPLGGRSNLKASFLCCLREDNDDLRPARKHSEHRKSRPSHPKPIQPHSIGPQDGYPCSNNLSHPVMVQMPKHSSGPRRKPVSSGAHHVPAQSSLYPDLPVLDASGTPQMGSGNPPSGSNRPQTQSLLSLIPSHLSPTTTAQLLSELSKPISPADEAGYIYVFWLTPDSDASKPDDETASSIMESISSDAFNTTAKAKRESDTLRRFASQRHGPAKPRTILLKIGRAANVHRRLSQWTKQCGNNITLIRYYPYHPSTANAPNQPDSGSTSVPHKVPHVHRVERLIHIELSEKRVKDQGPCESCGREHREWFEMPATREGLRTVDEVVRRWVTWAETR